MLTTLIRQPEADEATVSTPDVEAVRDWVGSQPNDATIQGYLDRPLTIAATALALLRRRLADLVGTPTSVSVPDDYSRTTDRSSDVAALRALIGKLEPIVDAEAGTDTDLPTITTGQLVRCTPGR